jgi:hypothetical protein
MKTGLSKVTQFHNVGMLASNTRGTSLNYNGSKGGKVAPYLRKEFWQQPSNQFWNSYLYSQASKEYFNDSISRM